MTVELLREAANDLEDLNLPESSYFDMTVYGEHLQGHEPTEQNHCGTTACAAGWLSLMPKWRARGMVAGWYRVPNGNWILQPAEGYNNWDELTTATFGRHLGAIVQELVFEKMHYSREYAIEEMRKIADNYETDEYYYDTAAD